MYGATIPRALRYKAPTFAGRAQVPVAAPSGRAPLSPAAGAALSDRAHVPIPEYGIGKGTPGVGLGHPIPAGFYDPTRDIELASGKREGFNTIEDIGTRRLRGENDYTTAVGQSQQNEQSALGEIQRAYQRLAGRQAEQQNASGTLYGGSALAAASARGANQQLGEAPVKLAAEREQGRLGLGHQREGEDLGTQQGRTESAMEQFGIDTNTLKTAEAIKNGYAAPGAAEAGQFPHVNPLTGAHYREIKQGGKTIHEYHDGRKVVLRG